MRPLTYALSAILLTLAASLSVPLAAAPARAVPTQDGARLTLGDRVVAIFRTANGDLDPQQRAELAAARLDRLWAAGLTADAITVRSRAESAGVYAGTTLLMIATPAESWERDETPEVTARRWARNLKAALSALPRGRPPAPARPAATPRPAPPSARPETAPDREGTLPEPTPTPVRDPGPTEPARPATRETPAVRGSGKFGSAPQSVVVPYGESRMVPFQGVEPGSLQPRVEGASVASVETLADRPAIVVRGLNPGRAVVRVQAGGSEIAFSVWVKKFAGSIPAILSAQVTGEAVPAALVRRVALERVLDSIRREPGASTQLLGEPLGARLLERGGKTTVEVPLAISGEGLLDVKTPARVEVQNVNLPPEETRVLLYSNNPESVRESGHLYEGLVPQDGPARLLFHHQNKMGRSFRFQVHLVNPGDTPVDVQIIGAEAGPILDPIQAGHRAGERYLKALLQDLGFVARIPGRSARILVASQLASELTISGIYTLRILAGGALVAQVVADTSPIVPSLRPDLLERARSEPHVYPTPQKSETYRYAVGQKWAFVHLGRTPIRARGENRKLEGNYGVLYRIRLDLSNPTDEPTEVRVLMSPDAGVARGVFVIDGKIVEAPQVLPPTETLLWKVRLAPGEHRKLSIQAMPVGGSNYPMSLVVRS